MMSLTRHQLFALMLGLGAANALARPVLVAVRDEGFMAVANGFGVSFVIWLSLGWALWALAHAPGEPPRKADHAVAGLFGLSLLIPVATVSWLITGFVALYWMNRGTTATIAASACAVVAFAALRDPLASLVLKLLATPLLDFDAVLVAHVLGWISEEAERAGLVSRVVPAKKLMEEAMSAAQKIAEKSLLASMTAKEAVNRSFEMTLSEGLKYERRVFHALFASEDQKEGMAAFLEKRAPQFRDK